MSYTKPMSTAEALANCANEFGLLHLTQLDIVVEGKPIKHYEHFELHQSAATHHHFTLTLGHDSLGIEQDHQLEDAQKMMGKRIRVTFSYKNIVDSPNRDFLGVITKVNFGTQQTNSRKITLQGYSPTVLLDGAAHVQSFGGKQPASLKTIVDSVIKEGIDSEKYKSRVEPNYGGNVSYSSQYEETHYNFLARTAEAYGEQFFYDGETLHFGKLPSGEKAISLIVGRDIDEVYVEMDSRHVKRSLYGYNSSSDEKLSSSETKISHQATIAKAAYDISEKTFKTPSLTIAPIKAATHKDIEAAQKSVNGSMAVNVFTTYGITSVPFLYPGCLVELNMRKPGSAEANYFTKLMIIEIEHMVDTLGNYSGCFKAIAADTGYLPRPMFTIPTAEDQTATVTDNKDTQGRIQVRFDWQMNGNTSEWIRVLSPDAGSSEQVGKNRGFVAIPEIGDQVMVGFIHGHPDRPYVKGGLFHGKVASGGGSGNNIKSLTSKSGHTVQLNDGGGITVKDKTGGNHIVVDGKDTITVTSSETVELTNGQSSIKMVGNKITIYADEIEIAKSGGESSKIEIKGLDTTLFGKTKVKVQSDTMAELSSKGITDVIAKAAVTVDGTVATVQAKAMTNILGGVVNLNGPGATTSTSTNTSVTQSKGGAGTMKPKLVSDSGFNGIITAQTGAIQSTYIANSDEPSVDKKGNQNDEKKPMHRLYFAAGANNDSDGWNYVERFRKAFSEAGISGFTRINASSGKAKDIAFTVAYRSARNRGPKIVSENGRLVQKTILATHPMIEKAFNGILQSQSSLQSEKNDQLNLLGYSYGSVLMAHVALKLADKGLVVNNLILVGSPISNSSQLFSELSKNAKIKKIIRHDIPNDKLSNPEDNLEFVIDGGFFQDHSDNGPHFALARPGIEADKKIKELVDKLKRSGVN